MPNTGIRHLGVLWVIFSFQRGSLAAVWNMGIRHKQTAARSWVQGMLNGRGRESGTVD